MRTYHGTDSFTFIATDGGGGLQHGDRDDYGARGAEVRSINRGLGRLVDIYEDRHPPEVVDERLDLVSVTRPLLESSRRTAVPDEIVPSLPNPARSRGRRGWRVSVRSGHLPVEGVLLRDR